MPLLVVEELVGAGGSKSVVSEGSSGQGRVGIRKSESIQRLSRQLSDIKVELQVSLTPSEDPSELSSSSNPPPPCSSEIAVPQRGCVFLSPFRTRLISPEQQHHRCAN